MVSLLLALCAAQQPPPQPRPVVVAVNTLRPGYGDQVVEGARVTIGFVAKTSSGEVLSDTEARGLAFTFLMGQDTVPQFWHDAVRGMKVGGVRSFDVPASAAGVTMDGDPSISVTVRLLSVLPL